MRWLHPLVLLSATACTGFGHVPTPTTAQRPTISSDTATTGEGTFELEAGAAVDPDDSLDTPIVVKWGAGPRTELFAGWSPLQQIEQPGPDAAGIADLQIGARHRFLEEGSLRPSAALQFATTLPTGDRSEGLSSGEIDFHAAAIVTKNVGDFTGTAFYEAGILGNGTGDTDLEHTLALAGSTAIGMRWGLLGELATVRSRERGVEDYYALVGGSYAVSSSLVFDVGAAFGLNDAAPDAQLLIGFTTNLGAPGSWFGSQ